MNNTDWPQIIEVVVGTVNDGKRIDLIQHLCAPI